MIETKEHHDAIDRIARTADGRILYNFLQLKEMEVAEEGSESALRVHHGERRFAAKLTALMRKGIQDSGGRSTSSSSGPGGAEPLVVVPSPEPVSASRPGGAGRRITERTHVPGYDGPEPPAGKT